MARAARDWAQLEAFEAEYIQRLHAAGKESSVRQMLDALAAGKEEEADWRRVDAERSRDENARRLLALRGKIRSLREKLGALPEGAILESERPFLRADAPPARPRLQILADPAPEGYHYGVTFAQIRALLAELPPAHVAPVHTIRLTNQRHTGSDGDWWDGEIRLHCLIRDDGLGKATADVERFGGRLGWDEDGKLAAFWPQEAYETFVLRRVLVHEIAHGVATLPGFAERVRTAGSVERFCELYAENFYRPPGPSVRLR